MGRTLTYISLFVLTFAARAQNVDTITISMKHVLVSYEDCVVKVELARKDHKFFLFPSNYSIGLDFDLTKDLFIVVEKKSEEGYRNYMCRYLTAHMDALSGDTIRYEKYTNLTFSDTLEDLGCLDLGQYRLRIAYNKRPQDGEIQLPDIIASSGWVYFYVKSNEILLSRYLRSGSYK